MDLPSATAPSPPDLSHDHSASTFQNTLINQNKITTNYTIKINYNKIHFLVASNKTTK